MPRNTVIAVIVSVLALGVLVLLGFGLTRKEAPGPAGVGTRVNRPAPDFALTLFSGEQIALSGLRGKPVVINFWASWCPPCREEAPTLEKVWRAYKDKGVAFIGVDIQDRTSDALAYIKEFDITYPNGPDIRSKIAADYGITGVPETFFVNRQGVIVSRWIGAISEKMLVAGIEEIMR